MILLHLGIEEVEILRHGYEALEKIFGRRSFYQKHLKENNGKNGVEIDKVIFQI